MVGLSPGIRIAIHKSRPGDFLCLLAVKPFNHMEYKSNKDRLK